MAPRFSEVKTIPSDTGDILVSRWIFLKVHLGFFLSCIVHGRMAGGSHGLPKVSLGPAMPNPSTLCERATPETAIRSFWGWPTHRVCDLRPSSTLLDTPRRTLMLYCYVQISKKTGCQKTEHVSLVFRPKSFYAWPSLNRNKESLMGIATRIGPRRGLSPLESPQGFLFVRTFVHRAISESGRAHGLTNWNVWDHDDNWNAFWPTLFVQQWNGPIFRWKSLLIWRPKSFRRVHSI
jgi:hypothetical protein